MPSTRRAPTAGASAGAALRLVAALALLRRASSSSDTSADTSAASHRRENDEGAPPSLRPSSSGGPPLDDVSSSPSTLGSSPLEGKPKPQGWEPPLLGVQRSRGLPRELRARVRAASEELAAAGLGPLANAALDSYGGGARMAEDLAMLRRGVSAVCGAARVDLPRRRGTTSEEGEEGAPDDPPSASAVHGGWIGGVPAEVLAAAAQLDVFFDWLVDELDARAAAGAPRASLRKFEGGAVWEERRRRQRESRRGLRGLAEDVKESYRELTRAAAASRAAAIDAVGGQNASKLSSNETASASGSSAVPVSMTFSCYRWSGYITRSLNSRGALGLPFEELIVATRGWSRRELAQCGLGGYEYAFDVTSTGGGENSTITGGSGENAQTLLRLARATDSCRRYGGRTGRVGSRPGVVPGDTTARAKSTDARQLRDMRAHYVAMERALREANDATQCLHTISTPASSSPETVTIAPALDPDTDGARAARLATGTALLSYLVGAIEDTLTTDKGCAKAEHSIKSVYYPTAAYDRIAQEMAQCGLESLGREWMAAHFYGGGSASLARQLDNAQAAVEQCRRTTPAAFNAPGNSSSSSAATTGPGGRRATTGLATPFIRVDENGLLSTMRHFRDIETALLGCRGGRSYYSAAGRLADTLAGYHADLTRGGCFASPPDAHTVKISVDAKGQVVESRDRSDPSKVVAAAESTKEENGQENPSTGVHPIDGTMVGSSGGGTNVGVGVITAAVVASALLAVLFGYFALVVRRNSRTSGGGRAGGTSGTLNSVAGSARRFYRHLEARSAGDHSAGRFYRHLEAGSAGDLPLVEDLDRVSSLRRDSGNDRGESSSCSSGGGIGATRKRSHSISEPASRPPLPPSFHQAFGAPGDGGRRSASISPRAERRIDMDPIHPGGTGCEDYGETPRS